MGYLTDGDADLRAELAAVKAERDNALACVQEFREWARSPRGLPQYTSSIGHALTRLDESFGVFRTGSEQLRVERAAALRRAEEAEAALAVEAANASRWARRIAAVVSLATSLRDGGNMNAANAICAALEDK